MIIVLSGFLMLFDRERGANSLFKFYYTHSTNIKIAFDKFFPNAQSSKRKLKHIQAYIEKINENGIKNSAFVSKLANELCTSIEKLISNYNEEVYHGIKASDPREQFIKAIQLTDLILDYLDRNSYHEKLRDCAIQLGQCLMHILQTGTSKKINLNQ